MALIGRKLADVCYASLKMDSPFFSLGLSTFDVLITLTDFDFFFWEKSYQLILIVVDVDLFFVQL